MKIPEFLVEFVTPIVRVSSILVDAIASTLMPGVQVTKGKEKINFFTIPEFQKWNEENNKDGKWYVKYYKVGHLCLGVEYILILLVK